MIHVGECAFTLQDNEAVGQLVSWLAGLHALILHAQTERLNSLIVVSDDGQLHHTRKCVGEEEAAFKFSPSEQSAQESQHLCVRQLQNTFAP